MIQVLDLSGIRTVVAHGPEFHADELDAAWDEVKTLVTPQTARSLGALGGIGPRSNPADGGMRPVAAEELEDDAGPSIGTVVGKADVTLETWRLAQPSMLVTGQWGPPERSARFLTVLNNPGPTGPVRLRAIAESFPERMALLDKELTGLIKLANSRYDRHLKSVPGAGGKMTKTYVKVDPADRGWVKALTSCLEDVRWAAGQLKKLGAAARVVEFEEYRGKKRVKSVFGRKKLWGIIAGKGNQKLPFAAYSTLPMATCPGAGTCSVMVDPVAGRFSSPSGTGYCYSVKAWRYPDAWARQFRNTLAEFLDREIAIVAGMGEKGLTATYEQRMHAALTPAGREARTWHSLVANLTMKALSRKIAAGKQTFLRIYVDGDMNSEDNIIEWMELAFQIGAGGKLHRPGAKHVECYGYSKCWNQFVNAGRMLGQKWPENYVLNLSSDSLYAGNDPELRAVRAAVEELKVYRGYFESIPLSRSIKQLNEAFVPGAAGRPASVREFTLPSKESVPHVFSTERVRSLVLLNGRMSEVAGSVVESMRVATEISRELDLGWAPAPDPKRKVPVIEQIRSGLFRAYFAKLLTDIGTEGFGTIVEAQLAKDDPRGLTVEQWRQKDDADKLKAAIALARKKGLTGADLEATAKAKVNKAKENRYTSKRWQDKALALALHEALVAYGPWGSCPLVCGNCLDIASDDPTKQAVHRCASKDAFKRRTIYIGRH